MKKLIIISNDKLHFTKNTVSSDFNDTINIIESLSKINYLNFFSRKKIGKGIHKAKVLNKSKLKISQLRSLEFKNQKICMISITPFNYFIFTIINLFNKGIKGFVILRSDGFKEYYSKFGFIGKKFYGFLFKKILKKLKPVVVTSNMSNLKNYKYFKICPSEITDLWKKNLKKPNLDIANLLYIGRIKKEKGIYSLLKLTKDLSIDYKLNIVGQITEQIPRSRNIKFYNETSNIKKIINFYDKNNIFILPSYTEGSPKVILESLTRLRPVIVFKEISHVKSNLKGIFISGRSADEFESTITYILKNYNKIQFEIKKNKILSRNKFQSDLMKIIK
jgi:glycosyltransferase involved in cell wall biosynthesis